MRRRLAPICHLKSPSYPHRVLSDPILSYPSCILPYAILAYSLPSHPILSHLVLCYHLISIISEFTLLILSPILSEHVKPILSYRILSYSLLSYLMLSYISPTPFQPILSTPSSPIMSHPVLSYCALMCPILLDNAILSQYISCTSPRIISRPSFALLLIVYSIPSLHSTYSFHPTLLYHVL